MYDGYFLNIKFENIQHVTTYYLIDDPYEYVISTIIILGYFGHRNYE